MCDSAVKSAPDGADAINTGLLNTAAVPKESPYPAVPDPAMVRTRAVDTSMERMRFPAASAT